MNPTRSIRFRLHCAAAVVLIGSTLGTVSLAHAEALSWTVNGTTRRAIVYAPRSASLPVPLVLSFHGHGDDMQNFQHTNLHVAWPDAVVAYFDGLPSPRDGYQGWQTERGQDGDRDLALVDAAIAALRLKYKIDPARIYATGFSNGANFTYLLWSERPDVLAAVAPVAARLRPSVVLKQPKPLFHVAGIQDRQIAFADQKDAIEVAKRANGVTGPGESCGEGCTLFSSRQGAPVMTWIHPGGHDYPAVTSARIVAFFRQHRLPTATP